MTLTMTTINERRCLVQKSLLVGCALFLSACIPACIPDQGQYWTVAGDAADATSDTGSAVETSTSDVPTMDMPEATDVPIVPDTTADFGSGPCNESPPSKTVEIYVSAEAFKFFFTPPGPNVNALYVPANSEVHFKFATSAGEEAHNFQIKIGGCTTPVIAMGTTGKETSYTWKAPKTADTYKAGGTCPVHPGMDFDIIVTP